MLIYILFFLGIISICVVKDLFVKNKHLSFILLSTVCLILIIFLGIKGKNVGSDTSKYILIYQKALNGEPLGHVSSDYGYSLICKVFAHFKLPYIWFSLFVSFLEVIGVFAISLYFSKYSAIFFSSFFALSQLQMLFSGQRQSIACSLVLVGVVLYFSLRKKNIFLRLLIYFLFCGIAVTFHKSALIACFFPILFKAKFNLKCLIIIGGTLFILWLFPNDLAQFFTRVNLTSYSNFNRGSIPTYSIFGFLICVVLYFSFSSVALLGNEEISFADVRKKYRNLFSFNYFLNNNVSDCKIINEKSQLTLKFIPVGLIGCIFMSFAPFSGTLTRFAFYCFPLLFISLSNVLLIFRKKERTILYFSMILAFFALFIWLFIIKDPLKCLPYYVEF